MKVTVTEDLGDKSESRSYEIAEVGPKDGKPVIWIAGSPIGADDYYPRETELYEANARVIGIGKPGYGDSPSEPHRKVKDAARWTSDVLQAYQEKGDGIKNFSVIGRSGGGPHALAIAGLLRSRVNKVVTLSSLSPYQLKDRGWSKPLGDDDWLKEMSQDNAESFSESRSRLFERFGPIARALQENPSALLDSLRNDSKRPLPAYDRNLLASGGHEKVIGRAHQVALRRTVAGWADDVRAVNDINGWGFQLENVECPALVVGHHNDPYTPIHHARRLAADIGDNAMLIEGHLGHFASIEIAPRALEWLAADSPVHEQVALDALRRMLRAD